MRIRNTALKCSGVMQGDGDSVLSPKTFATPRPAGDHADALSYAGPAGGIGPQSSEGKPSHREINILRRPPATGG